MKNTHASQKLLPLHNVSLRLLWIIRLVPSTANTPAWVLTTICSSPKGQRPNIGTQMDRAAMRHTVDLQVACSCIGHAHQSWHEVICWWAHCDNEGGQSPSLLRPCPISHAAEKCEQPIEEPGPWSTTTIFFSYFDAWLRLQPNLLHLVSQSCCIDISESRIELVLFVHLLEVGACTLWMTVSGWFRGGAARTLATVDQ